MKKIPRVILSLVLFMLFGNICFQNAYNIDFTPDEEKQHPVYIGVNFVIPGSLVKDYKDIFKDASQLLKSRGGVPPNMILDNLIKRFDEAVSAYNSGKGKLPSCLREALDRFLDDLKNGAKKLDIGYSNGEIGWDRLRGDEMGEVLYRETYSQLIDKVHHYYQQSVYQSLEENPEEVEYSVEILAERYYNMVLSDFENIRQKIKLEEA
jgi:hypothetical protein